GAVLHIEVAAREHTSGSDDIAPAGRAVAECDVPDGLIETADVERGTAADGDGTVADGVIAAGRKRAAGDRCSAAVAVGTAQGNESGGSFGQRARAGEGRTDRSQAHVIGGSGQRRAATRVDR